ncbi:protein kinase [Kitasatospora sp. NPDC048540]|uniref:class III lanthionine synthetase LanKC N-terminal domain-containing protein n=1 Tax=Kitasatospora sp. NPDC048540 TaxID=3155634 RepID=UPI0033CC2801
MVPADSIWRLSRESHPADPDQGWKLHISATILTANRVLSTAAPELMGCGVLFKAPRSLAELLKLNSGFPYGVSQVGKFMTVYPRGSDEAADLASRLDALTRGIPGPCIPFERPYRQGSRVFYRYGSFQALQAKFGSEVLPALRGPDGDLVPDVRTDPFFDPSWCPNPFPPRSTSERPKSHFGSRYLAYEPIMQRGKGGVYKALDMAETPLRRCIVKEGRCQGETWWDGRDGKALMLAESHALEELADAGVNVPKIIEMFEEQRNLYLVLEHLGERTVEDLLRDAVTLPVEAAIGLAATVAECVAEVHEAGWAWRDIKPRNVMIDDSGVLHPIDFEGACRSDARNLPPWGSEGYVAPEWLDPMADHVEADLFALGVTCYQILAGARSFGLTVGHVREVPIGRRRHGIPEDVRRLVSSLLGSDPDLRPSARTAAEVLSPFKAPADRLTATLSTGE